jgi:hypothetical protein
MGAVDRLEVLRGSSAGIVPHLARRRVTFSALNPYLQLWHLHWFSLLQSVGDRHSHVPYVLYFSFQEDAAPIVRTGWRLDASGHGDVVHLPLQQYQFNCYTHRGLRACTVFVLYVFYDPSITTDL